jgi:circadian clock protein KaiB
MAEGAPEVLKLTLYIAGQTPKSLAAIRNLEALCSAGGDTGAFEVEVIDLKERPQLAREHNIIAIPTLVRSLPAPVQKIIGDLSDKQKVLVHLQVGPAQ